MKARLEVQIEGTDFKIEMNQHPILGLKRNLTYKGLVNANVQVRC